MYPVNKEEAIQAMKSCNQMSGQTIFQHGKAVALKFLELQAGRILPEILDEWVLPDWWNSEILWGQIPNDKDFLTYCVYHDVGKPSVCSSSGTSHTHFPDHERVSASIAERIGLEQNVCDLIRHDMLVHRSKPSDCSALLSNPIRGMLVISALCEIHANAELFGGTQSDSFRIKWKRLNSVGKKVVESLGR